MAQNLQEMLVPYTTVDKVNILTTERVLGTSWRCTPKTPSIRTKSTRKNVYERDQPEVIWKKNSAEVLMKEM